MTEFLCLVRGQNEVGNFHGYGTTLPPACVTPSRVIGCLFRDEQEAFMTAGRAEVLSLEAEAWEKGFKIGIKLATYFELLADAWTARFGAPVEEALADRLVTVENPRVLRQCFALVIRATDAATATREVEELLARY